MTTLPIGSPRLAAPPEALDEDPPLSTVMSRDVVSIDAEARLPTALHVMATTGVRHLPVVDRGRVLGVLVETDLIRCLARGRPPVRHSASRSPCDSYTAPHRSCHRPPACPTPPGTCSPTCPTRCSSPTTAAFWVSSPPPTWCACSPAAKRSARHERHA